MYPQEFLCHHSPFLSARKVGLLFRKITKALEKGDVEYLRSLSFIGRLYRPPQKRKGITPTIRRLIIERDGRVCLHCGTSERLQIDHIKPVVFGGGDESANLQTLCRSCNLAKGPKAHARKCA